MAGKNVYVCVCVCLVWFWFSRCSLYLCVRYFVSFLPFAVYCVRTRSCRGFLDGHHHYYHHHHPFLSLVPSFSFFHDCYRPNYSIVTHSLTFCVRRADFS